MKKALIMMMLLYTSTISRSQNTDNVISIIGHEVDWQTQKWDTIHPSINKYDYDNLGNLVKLESSSWGRVSGNKWVKRKLQERYEYDMSGTLKFYYLEPWDTTQMVWIKQNKNEYFYLQNGNIDSVIWKYWDSNVQLYKSYTKIVHHYNAQNKLVEKISYEAFNGQWIQNMRRTYNYDIDDRLVFETYGYWDKNNSNWKPIEGKSNYTYSLDGKLITKIDSVAGFSVNNPLVADYHTTYKYDTNGLLIEYLEKFMSNLTANWENHYLNTYSNNTNGKVDYFLKKAWDGNGWDDSYRQYYNYVPLTGIAHENYSSNSVFPNPTMDYIFIETNEQIIDFQINDTNGRKVNFTFSIINNEINLRNLPSGIYILSYKTENKTYKSRIIKY
jgi:hypothetical protein